MTIEPAPDRQLVLYSYGHVRTQHRQAQLLEPPASDSHFSTNIGREIPRGVDVLPSLKPQVLHNTEIVHLFVREREINDLYSGPVSPVSVLTALCDSATAVAMTMEVTLQPEQPVLQVQHVPLVQKSWQQRVTTW